ALIIGLFLFLIGTEISKGLSSGGSFFTMADVNLLFLSPVSPRKILAYGLIKQIGVSLLMGIFILFQGTTLREFFGVDPMGMFFLFIGYCVFLVLAEVLALAIYSFSNGDRKKKQLVKNIMYCFVFLIAALFLTTLAKNQNVLDTLIQTADSKMVEYIPIVGWIKGFIIGLISGNFLMAIIYFVLLALLGGLLIMYICRSDADYYEDVLQAAETAYHTKAAAKQGHLSDAKDASKISRKNTGIHKGKGASVFFFKHMLENKRSGYLFLNQFTLIMAVLALAASIFARGHISFILIFGALTYMQCLTSTMGRWIKELPLPYIYMIPQKPFKKLIFASLESVVDSFISGIIIFVPCGFILGAPVTLIAAAILARVGIAALLSAGNILVEKILGSLQ
ncbi:MAG: putative ABC exporter domain-containing protein, partial [Eubacterium sp.]